LAAAGSLSEAMDQAERGARRDVSDALGVTPAALDNDGAFYIISAQDNMA